MLVRKEDVKKRREREIRGAYVYNRRLQYNGYSSFFAILPADFVKRNGLKTGSMLDIVDDGQKTLTIRPSTTEEFINTVQTISKRL